MSANIQVVKYKVKKEDCLWNIVKNAGFPPKDWNKILKAPYNKNFAAKLKREKRSPDKIFPGEIIYLPAFNAKVIMKKYEAVKKKRIALGKGLQNLAIFERQIGKVREDKRKQNAEKLERIEKLEKEYRRKDEAIRESNKPVAGEHPSERAGKAVGKAWLRYTEGVMDMKKEANALRREVETSSSNFKVRIMRLEGIVKKIQKEINATAVELKKSEAELSNMLKNPY